MPILRAHHNICFPSLVQYGVSGAGRPKIEVDTEWLKEVLSRGRHISQEQLAKVLKISKSTLQRRIKEYGLKDYVKYDQLGDEELDGLIESLKEQKPDLGRRYAMGHVQSIGLRIQRDQIQQSLCRVDGLGQELRCHQTIEQRQYSVPRSNHLWHIDGHHKLIKWGIVIHGVIDGYCRTVSAHLNQFYTQTYGLCNPGDRFVS